MTEAKARQKLQDYVEAFDTNAEAARDLGISRQVLYDVLSARRGVSESIAGKIGLCLTVRTTRTYREVQK